MKFAEFEDEVRNLVTQACESLGYPSAQVEVALPPNLSYGDLSTAVPLRLAKDTGGKAGDIALKLSAAIMGLVGGSRYVGGVAAHQGGYVNFTIKFDAFALDTLTEINGSEVIGAGPGGKSFAIEHTNVNPNKALHIGHARNLVLGDSLVRVMRHLGHSVQALNYIDDSGAQVADIIVGFKFLGISEEAPLGMKFDTYCGDSVYSKVNQEYAKDPGLKAKQSLVLQEVERGQGEIAEYTRSVVNRILADQLATCWRLGASYDLLNWESHIVHSGVWERIFETLKSAGVVTYEKDGANAGCWVISDPETKEQKVVVRSDGTAVYVAKDIPYAAWKIGIVDDPFGYALYKDMQPGGGPLFTTALKPGQAERRFGAADVAVSVIDTRQSYLQRIVAKVLDRLEEGSARRYLHRSYEVVALSKRTAASLGLGIDSEFAHMSGRKGIYVNVDAVLDALRTKAREETRKRNLDADAAWLDDVAEAIAVAAVRYDLLKQDPDKMIVFDLDESLKFEGDTGPYLLYTYARARRIFSKTEGKPAVTLRSAGKLSKRQEKELLKSISMLDKSVAKAGEYLSPKEVAVYAHDLAVKFNDFYEHVPVNKEEDAELRDARLALVEASSRVLAQAMRLMGIPYRNSI